MKDIEKWSKERDRCQQLKFGYFKEESIADFKDYYQQLISTYRLRLERYLKDTQRQYAEDYEKLKQSLQRGNQETFDLKKKYLEKELLVIKLAFVVDQTPIYNNDVKRKKYEIFEKMKAKKLYTLNRKNRQLKFCEEKIKSVLRNYMSLVVTTGDGHLLDKNNFFQKYLDSPMATELKQVIHDEESPKIIIAKNK